MIRLATKADVPFINSVINHPKVRPHIWEGDYQLDSTESIEYMWTLVSDSGVMMAESLGNGNYLALTAFEPSAWGIKAVVEMRRGIRKIFEETDCHRLYATIHQSNERAIKNAIGLGFHNLSGANGRVTACMDYLDGLDKERFKKTVLAGWSGKALYWWNVKAKLNGTPPAFPLDPERPIFSFEGDILDLREVAHG